MAYSQQYPMQQYQNDNYQTPSQLRSRHQQNDSIPTAANNIVLNQPQPKYNNNPNANGYYQQPQQPQQQQPRRQYHGNGPPPITSSHKQHIKQNKRNHRQQQPYNNNNHNNNNHNHNHNDSSSDGMDEEDENGQVVIYHTKTDTHTSSKSNVSYSNNSNYNTSPNNSQYRPNKRPNDFNDYNSGYPQNNGYNDPNNAVNGDGYIPPYASYNNTSQNINGHAINTYNNNNNNNNNKPPPPRQRQWNGHQHQQQPQPPPLPKHKMQNYGKRASSKNINGYHNSNSHHAYQPPPPNSNKYIQSPQNSHSNNQRRLEPASSEPQFATSFEQFDDNILDDNDENDVIDTFAPIHYDQRFSMHKNNALRQSQIAHHSMNKVNKHHDSQSKSKSNHSRSSHSNSNTIPSQQPQPPPPTQPPPAHIHTINKQLHKQRQSGSRARYKVHNNNNNNTDIITPQLAHGTSNSKNGAMNITITKSNTDSYVESTDKQATPSHSRNGSETRESEADFEILQRDKDYRPSIVMDLQHTDTTFQVTIDRYGFPMDDEIDEKEHRKQVKKENGRLLKWQDMIFSKKSGGTSAESNNEVDEQINHWNNVKNHRKLKSRIRKGVPQQLRGTIWQNLSGARERRKIECARYGSKNLYNDLKGRKKSKYHDQIWKDINRTYRKNLIFGASQLANAQKNQQNTDKNSNAMNNNNKKGTQKFFKNILQDPHVLLTPQDLERNATPAQIALYNVLKAFSLYRRDIGYCQGMQAVTALLLMYMTEEEAFWVLASLADDTKYQMDNLWRPSMPAIQLRFYQMERLVKITLPKLSQHFERCGITSASMYQASQWFITIFLATDMRFATITRVWDIYLNEGLKTVFRMGVGFLKYFEKPLLKSDFEEMLEMFRIGASKIDPEEYIKVCFAQRITHAQLAAFEKDFNRQQQKKH